MNAVSRAVRLPEEMDDIVLEGEDPILDDPRSCVAHLFFAEILAKR
jgi:hypothetical protein